MKKNSVRYWITVSIVIYIIIKLSKYLFNVLEIDDLKEVKKIKEFFNIDK